MGDCSPALATRVHEWMETMRRTLLVIATLSLSVIGLSVTPDNSGAAAFARIRALAGDWKGGFEWTGALSDSGEMNAAYFLTGNGSAVVETLTVGGVPSMTSVYHMDGADLRMTHYCGAQNQPRLVASRIDLVHGTLGFDFVDITNLRSPDAPHVRGLEIRFLDADDIALTFLFGKGARQSQERIVLKRAGPRAPTKP
jgi:hypothetical protein